METELERSERVYNEKIQAEATHYRDTNLDGSTFKHRMFYRIVDGRPQYLNIWNSWSNHTYNKATEKKIIDNLKPYKS